MERDTEYLRRRALEERQAALASQKVSVRLRHLEFAEVYEFRLREIQAQERRSTMEFIDAA